MLTPVISILALASFVVHPESGDKVYLVGSSIWESPSMRVMLTFVIGLNYLTKGNNGHHNDGDDGGFPHHGHSLHPRHWREATSQ